MGTSKHNVAARMGRWSASHRKSAIFGWLALVGAVFALGTLVGTNRLGMADQGAGEALRAASLLKEAGAQHPARESVLVQGGSMSPRDPRFRAAVADVVAAVKATGRVQNVRSPLDQAGHGLVSRDGRSVLVQFELKGDPETAEKQVGPVLEAVERVQRSHSGLRIEQFGAGSSMKALHETMGRDFQRAELFSLPLTLLILLVAFGAVVAAVLPFVLALTAFVGALGLVSFTSHVFPIDQSAISIMLLIGLAVGVDYSLFYIRREREERAAGRGPAAALEAAAATSGRAVLVSGLTVIVAMAGLYLTGTTTFRGVATGTILVVGTAVAGSLTVLPALLSKLGDRVDRGRIPLLHRLRRSGGESRVWSWTLRHVLARPAVATIAAGGALLVLAAPTLGLEMNQPGADDLPRSLPVVKTYERIQAAFPGGSVPAEVVIRAHDANPTEVADAIAALRKEALATGEVHEPIHAAVDAKRGIALVSIPLAGDGNDEASEHALQILRERVIPKTVGEVEGVEVAVGGQTAFSTDFNNRLKERAPFVFAFVLGLAFLLLLTTFRSLVVAAKAIVLNLLSVGAAYGILVAVFQWGWGESLLGFESTGGITAWIPLFLFVVLFGLSMDYHVFILSRVREAYDRGMRTEDAVAHAITSTAGVVTSAAVVMVGVFSIFGTLSQVSMKQAGVGLAVAVLLDATIVRAVLLPAAMKLLGDWNWYLPRWLEWLPELSLEAKKERIEAAPALNPAGR